MRTFWCGIALLVMGVGSSSAEPVSFNRDIRPILSQNCFHCHGPDEHDGRKAGLRLDTREGALADHDGVRAIVPGDPEASEAIYRVFVDDEDEIMPPADSIYALTAEQKQLLKRWVAEGAEYEGHWAFTPPVINVSVPVPELVDAHVRDRLEKDDLQPSASANRETLIRRLSLDLRGIPPTLAEIDAFLADESSDAWASLVDRFLASPECAERLALDWLDVARYADTNGYSIDDHRDMWVWRDWVINAFLQNQPYDDFLIEQLAGDLMPDATPQQKMATGFLRNSMNTHEGGTIAEEYRVAYLVDKVDTVSTTFLGLTMKCAQCHDHKYDPISMKDYYRFYAFFDAATERGKGADNGNTAPVLEVESPLVDKEAVVAELEQRLAHLRDLRFGLPQQEPEVYAAWTAEKLGAPGAAAAPVFEFSWPKGAAKAEWIWNAATNAAERVRLRTNFYIGQGLESAWLRFSADNQATVFVNGKQAAKSDDWTQPVLVDITSRLQTGQTRIGVEALNVGGPAGFIAWLQLDYEDGRQQLVRTGSDWEAVAVMPETTPTAWDAKDGWTKAVSFGAHGVAPWNRLPEPKPNPDQGRLLADALRTPEAERSDSQRTRILDAFIKQRASSLTKRFAKSKAIEISILEKQLKDAGRTTVMVMDNPGKRTTRMLERGQYDAPGEAVTMGVPAVFPPLPEGAPVNRLGLAQWMVDEANPLTARVAVNRYWQLLFGTGLVKTAEDFGSQGEWPSHPELLDALAVHFRDSGWDIKALLRGLVLSETYRQQSRSPAELREVDPYNRLLARFPRKRLPAELVRDNALTIGGLLNPQVGGPSVYPQQPDGLWRQVSHFGYGRFTAQAYYPDAGDPAHRRSMYTFWKRTAPPPGMAVFDAPSRETCTVRRLQTNTPLQALVLLNDPQYLRAAAGLARRMVSEAGEQPEDRIEHAFRLATGRRPIRAERDMLVRAFQRELERFSDSPTDATALFAEAGAGSATPELAAYAMVASTILNLDETITRP